MDQRTEPIKQDIDNIRDSMTEKLSAIEDKVKGTVDETVEKVKGQVTDTVETVKQAFDIKQQVGDHPWAALGVSLLAGYVLGTLGDSDSDNNTQYRADYSKHDQPRYQYAGADYSKSEGSAASGYNSSAYSSSAPSSGYVSGPAQSSPGSYNSFAQPQSKQGGFLNDLLGQFGGELDTIKTAAISSLVAMVRDTIKDAVPQFGQEYERVRQQHDDTPSSDSDATLNTLLRQPVDGGANTTSGSRDFSNTGSYSASGYGSGTGTSSETDSTMGSAIGAQDRDLGDRSVGTRSYGATETTT
ncbi:MAG: hypothetical protein H7Y32_21660 [Chloroflexales bacterium]|nr:hypothetical protein [Chloroflexales bacterium]